MFSNALYEELGSEWNFGVEFRGHWNTPVD